MVRTEDVSRLKGTWAGGIILLIGSLLGYVLATGRLSDLLDASTVALVLLAAFAAWLDIQTKHYGYISLAPAVCLPVASFVGLREAALAMLLGHLVMVALRRSWNAAVDTIIRGSEETLSLILAYSIAGLVLTPRLVPTVAMLGVMLLLFFALDYVTRSIRIAVVEGAQLGRLTRPLLRSMWTRYAFVGFVAAINYAFFQLVGPTGLYLATVVLSQVYYPWKLLDEQRDLFLRSLQMMSQAVDLKDPYTSHHSQRVAQYAVRIARAMGVSEDEVERVRIGGLMHDIGKIAVPVSIIRKPAKLTDDEMTVMKGHTIIGARIIADLDVLSDSALIVRHHHENYDGTGYPDGLKDDEIPLGSKAILVADAFDALTTDRPYRKGRGVGEALSEIGLHVGRQFDPDAVEAFRKALRAKSKSRM